ncbi:MAG: T9SS type A sorting domain-containing protein [Candidatus Coatesbacteria bacterium]|nr:T9SS type A sorting domain-containing protein [Candidatus Coatesbacteria bacterium]
MRISCLLLFFLAYSNLFADNNKVVNSELKNYIPLVNSKTGAEGDTLKWDDGGAETWSYVSDNAGARIGVHFITPYPPETPCYVRGGLFYLFNSSRHTKKVKFSVQMNSSNDFPDDNDLELKESTISDTPVSPAWVSMDFSDLKVTGSDTQVFWLVMWWGEDKREPRVGKDTSMGEQSREHYAYRDSSSSWTRSTTANSIPMFRAIVSDKKEGFEGDDQFSRNIPVKTHFCLNSPNPFIYRTKIAYCIGNDLRGKEIELAVYDLKGRKKAVISRKRYNNGIQYSYWNGTDEKGMKLPAGIYFYRLASDGKTVATAKTVILR